MTSFTLVIETDFYLTGLKQCLVALEILSSYYGPYVLDSNMSCHVDVFAGCTTVITMGPNCDGIEFKKCNKLVASKPVQCWMATP